MFLMISFYVQNISILAKSDNILFIKFFVWILVRKWAFSFLYLISEQSLVCKLNHFCASWWNETPLDHIFLRDEIQTPFCANILFLVQKFHNISLLQLCQWDNIKFIFSACRFNGQPLHFYFLCGNEGEDEGVAFLGGYLGRVWILLLFTQDPNINSHQVTLGSKKFLKLLWVHGPSNSVSYDIGATVQIAYLLYVTRRYSIANPKFTERALHNHRFYQIV